MSFVEQIGLTLNGWVAALGGVAVVFALTGFMRAYHDLYVRRVLWKMLLELKKMNKRKG